MSDDALATTDDEFQVAWEKLDKVKRGTREIKIPVTLLNHLLLDHATFSRKLKEREHG